MDDNFIFRDDTGEPGILTIEECEIPQLKEAVNHKFQTLVEPSLLKASYKASKLGANLRLIISESHRSCASYWFGRKAFKWARSLGITQVLFEVDQKWISTLTHTLHRLQTLRKPGSVYSAYLPRDPFFIAKLSHAKRLNFTIVPGDPLNSKKPIWEIAPESFFTYIGDVVQGKINEYDEFNVHGTKVDLSECPDFLVRDTAIVETFLQTKGNLVATYGAAHLSQISDAIKKSNTSHFVDLLINCAPKSIANSCIKDDSDDTLRARSFLFDLVFGGGCGTRYLQSLHDCRYAFTSPEVIQFDVEHDVIVRREQ